MLKRSLKEYLFLIPPAIAFLLFSTNVWNPQPVIVPLPLRGFVGLTENVIPFLLLLFYAFLLHDSYEIELGLVCGVKTTKLAFTKAIPIFLYIFVTMLAIILCHRYEPYTSTQYRIRIAIYVPENYKLYLLVSAFVTVLFFSALFFFLRVLSRNCYVPIGVGLFIWFAFETLNTDVRETNTSITWRLWDPFISNYFIGNTVPNRIAEELPDLSSVANVWTHNRLLFFGLSVALLVATWLLLRREKLHEGLGD